MTVAGGVSAGPRVVPPPQSMTRLPVQAEALPSSAGSANGPGATVVHRSPAGSQARPWPAKTTREPVSTPTQPGASKHHVFFGGAGAAAAGDQRLPIGS